jgi:replication factor A1
MPTSKIVLDLLARGWRKDDLGNLYYPDQKQIAVETAERESAVDSAMNSSWNTDYPESEPGNFGEPTYTKTCPHCNLLFSGTDKEAVELQHHAHVMVCRKNKTNVATIPSEKPAKKKSADKKPPLKKSVGKKTARATVSKTGTVAKEATVPKTETVAKKATVSKTEEQEKMDNTNVAAVIESATGFGAKDIDPAVVTEKLAILQKFRVADDEAVRSVVSGILRAQAIKRPKGAGGGRSNAMIAVDTIKSDGVWCSLKVKVVDLWHNNHDSIRQVGLIGDESGTTKFVSWENANLPLMEEGKSYRIENVVTKEYEGTFSVAFNKTTKITEIEADIEVGYTTAEFTGILVAVQNGSGLIKRCTQCNRAMLKGTCQEHGNVAGKHDLRIKAVLDNGVAVQNILLNGEKTEAITGISLSSAIEMAQEALDADIVADRIRDMLLGREYEAIGRTMGDTMLIESMTQHSTAVPKGAVEELIAEV